MTVLRKLFADVVGPNFMKQELDLPISSEKDAVRFCLENEALYFQTYEISLVTINNKEFHTDPENYSERRYVGINRIYNAAELLSILEGQYVQARIMSDEFSSERRKNLKEKIQDLKHVRPDTSYIEEPGGQNAYIRLNPADKVYDTRGSQKWPRLQR